jgi:polar amino acid transport system substrate-binding protein
MKRKTQAWLASLAVSAAMSLGALSASAADIGVGSVDLKAIGDGSYKRVLEQGITLGISNDPPYTYQDDKTKEYDGIDVRIFREIAKRLGIEKVQWELVQFDALIPGLTAERWDVVVDNLHENPKRLAVISFSGPSYWYGSALAVQKGNPQDIHSWEGMAGHVVGTIRGSINQQLLEKRSDLKELKLYTSNEAEFADLIAGRIDVAMEDDLKVGQFLKQHPDVPMERASGYVPQPDEYGYARYGIRKADVDLNLAVSRALA